MTQPHRAPRLLVALLAAGVVAAGCTGGGTASSPTAAGSPTTAPPPSAIASRDASASPAPDALVIRVADNPAGRIVVDGAGRSLYLFTRDTQGSGKSVCQGDCAASWPPLLAGAAAPAAAGDGITGTLGTATRDDGSLQVTLGGWPLYYFAGDAAAGDANGQGVNDAWWLVAPDGTPINGPDVPDAY